MKYEFTGETMIFGDLVEGEDFYGGLGVVGVEREEFLDPVERFMRDIESGLD
jgi:hypothetical protein